MFTITVIIVLLAAIYHYGTRNFDYWKKRGVKHDKPIPFIGTSFSRIFFRKSIPQVTVEAYNKYPNEKVVGLFKSTAPELVIRDPELIKRVIKTDFPYFYPRGLNPHKTAIEPLMRNLFFADGDLWRLLRQRMTPAFTSGKLRAMFPLIVERAERLKARALSAAAAGHAVDARDLMARYTTDFIGACGFGIDADSLGDENSAFRKLGVNIFRARFKDAAIAVLKNIFPGPFKHFKMMERVEKDVFELSQKVLQQRNYEPSGRNDFVDLLLECKKKGLIVGQSVENVKTDGSPEITSLELTDELIAAQMFVFFAAGFETSSATTSFTLHQLAFNPDVQKKVQRDIDLVLAKHGGQLSYDAVKEMTYLEWSFKESMRIFPSVGYLVRKCARQYTFPELDLTIDPDVGVFIPVHALHNDPKYFENPDEFRPERFDPKVFDAERNKYIYLPFGDGPRACIGSRLGLMQSMAGLAAVLSKFTVEPAPSTMRHPIIDPSSNIVQAVKGGLPLYFRERETTVLDTFS